MERTPGEWVCALVKGEKVLLLVQTLLCATRSERELKTGVLIPHCLPHFSKALSGVSHFSRKAPVNLIRFKGRNVI